MRFSPEGGESAKLAKEVQNQDLEIGLHEWDAEIQQEKITKLEGLATTDELTGLDNLRAFNEKLEQTLRMVRESKAIPEEHRRGSRNVFALIALDVDYFKKINDTLGHPAGDEVLRQFAKLLRESVRGTDSVARIGGEEFGLIMLGASAESAARHAEELRKKIEAIVFEAYPDLTVTSSFGIASSEMSDDPNTLKEYADKALYEAKRAGRNQVVTYQEQE